MKVEIRGESVILTGYVNAVERYSKPIKGKLRGEVQRFIEKIGAGAFKTALKRNDNVKVLLNHKEDRELANTKDGTARLEEDNIGLRAEVTITDAEVVEKAKNNKLVGWSFGFRSNADNVGDDGTIATRTITDLDLEEVSILDDTRSPAYNGTSIETRDEEGAQIEIRENIEEPADVKNEAPAFDTEQFAEIVAKKVLEKLNAPKEEEHEEEQEETRELDYSEFEKRIANIK